MHKKTAFLFFTVFLTFSILQGNIFSGLFNRIGHVAFIKAFSLRHQIFLKTRELKRLEKTYKVAFNNALNNTEYVQIDNAVYKLFKKNYIIQKEINCETRSHLVAKLINPTGFIKKQESNLALYDALCVQREYIYTKTYGEIYTKNYYSKKRDIFRARRLLNEKISITRLQKKFG